MKRVEFKSHWIGLREVVEKKIRSQCSEHVILEVHDNIYQPVKCVTTRQLAQPKDTNSDILVREMRKLIESNARERELQKCLIKLEKSKHNACEIYSEVLIEKPNKTTGRIDLLLYPKSDDDTGTIFELKRSSFKLIARRRDRKTTARLKKAIEQIKNYGLSEVRRCKSGSKAHDTVLNKLLQKLIIGRRMQLPGEYIGIIGHEKENPNLQIYTWDAWIAEFERIYT